MIHGYPASPSVVAGGQLRLHVSTSAPRYRVDFYRQGDRLVPLGSTDWRAGHLVPPGPADRDWRWPAEDFHVPDNWPSGAYLALLVEGGFDGRPLHSLDAPPSVDGRDARALFVVRSPRPGTRSKVLYKLPWMTYQAYNASGGGSLYLTRSWLPSAAPITVTTRRPGGGTGGVLSFPGATDVYDPATPREGFGHWDAPMIRWLERHGYAVEMCTDLDLHREPELLEAYALLLCVGHDEYWSGPVRAAVERFIRGGGNVAFFAGNVCWWRVDVADDGAALTCKHPVVAQPDTDQWWRHAPENTLSGVSYRAGGGWWTGPREPLGYTVQHAGHWVYDGCGLAGGEAFGANERLVGYECDGAQLVATTTGLQVASGVDGSPTNLTILGVARLGSGWQDRPAGANAAATLALHSRPGTVFSAGTTDWSRVLADGHPVVERITANILDHLAVRSLPVDGPYPLWCGQMLAVAGQPARFRVDTGLLAGGGAPRCAWRLAAGDEWAVPLEGDAPEVEVLMPQVPCLTTLSVRVDGPQGAGFGTCTVRVLSAREAEQVLLLDRLRELVVAAVPPLLPTAPVQAGNRPFGAPEWELVGDGLRRLLDRQDLQTTLDAAEQVLAAARRLADTLTA